MRAIRLKPSGSREPSHEGVSRPYGFDPYRKQEDCILLGSKGQARALSGGIPNIFARAKIPGDTPPPANPFESHLRRSPRGRVSGLGGFASNLKTH